MKSKGQTGHEFLHGQFIPFHPDLWHLVHYIDILVLFFWLQFVISSLKP